MNNAKNRTTHIPCSRPAKDAESVFKSGSYHTIFELTFDHCVPLSIAKARVAWVIQYLQAAYVGVDEESFQSGLEGLALYDPADPAGVQEVLVLLEGHPRIVIDEFEARFKFEIDTLAAIKSDPGARLDPSTLAWSNVLITSKDANNFDIHQTHAEYVPGKMAWHIWSGALQ